ncbi:MAG: hypothetical protein EAZ51_03990 [Sphingobacteriales bacterium]|nr:MAG: hypothetical protein EAZ64_03765 [Sphingobacteriales bacterium]TAF81540.1 MAG: hypothetical protein EAZ51_03990 [Sphingobacteriales bacterium]
MKYKNIREEELKNKVGADWFKTYDTTEILGNVDFTVFPKQNNIFGRTPLLWAEAKTGNFDVTTMFVQLVLTIGKARTFDKTLPPAFLGAFDFKKIAFVPYISIQDIFYINDFNWNVTPSNHETKEFKLIKNRIETTLKQNTYIYDYQADEKDLKTFITNNIANSTETNKVKIDKNNFIPIYLRWLEIVKPIIDVNWDDLKKANILDNDFYLADLFVDDKDTHKIDDDTTIRDNLFVIFQNQGYKIEKENIKQMFDATINIKNKETYTQFWKRYKRPPVVEFQNYIIERRDLLVPQDIRERKGAFFTPRQWVELSQEYLADYLGENWQDEYYIWDCAAGTGNLLAGLTNKYNIWASTLDQADVKVMHNRIEHGAILLQNHVFQFDFLNDDFSKLPQGLQEILNDENKRKKLIIFINPPYAEAASKGTISNTGTNKTDVAVTTMIYNKYKNKIGIGGRELFVQFLTRIYAEIPNVVLAEFSTLKILQAPNFLEFREFYQAKLEKIFLVQADSFDNVKGKFPIGFFIWNTDKKERFENIEADIYDSKGEFIGNKNLYNSSRLKSINDWLITTRNRHNEVNIGFLSAKGNDFQNVNFIFIINEKNQLPHPRGTWITDKNIIEVSIYVTVRHIIPSTWLNDRDQFIFPNDGWKTDIEFKNDCLTFTLFDNCNTIQSKFGVNYWIPFTESEVNAKEKFESNFMSDFIKGKIKSEKEAINLFDQENHSNPKNKGLNNVLQFSTEAHEVFDAGKELWKYYHQQKDINVNAGLYDIKAYFQGRNHKGRMNAKSTNEKYTELMGNLRQKLNILSDKITPKIYVYEFLKQ